MQTRRLNLVPVQESDVPYLISLYGKKEIMKEIYLGKVLLGEEARMRAEVLVSHWKESGIGFYKIIQKENNIPMGYIGFRLIKNQHPDLEGWVEIGYILDVPYWSQGYVSEAVKVCIEEGFEKFKFKSITATILPSNQASIAIVKKMGFELMGQYLIHGVMHEVFRLKY